MKKTQLVQNKHIYYPSLIITLCASFLFFKYILQVYPSVITQELMHEFKLSGFSLGNLAAVFYYTYVVTQLFSGVIIDYLSPRYLTSSAILVGAIGLLLFSQADSFWLAMLSRGLMGVGVAFATVAYLKFASLWVSKKQYALVSGLLATAAMAGAVFGQGPLAYLIGQLGWRQALMLVAFLGFILAFLFVTIVRDRTKEPLSSKDSIQFKDILAIFKNKQNWLLSLYSGLAFSPITVLGGLWGNPFLEQAYSLGRTEAASLISLIFIGLGLGSPLLGMLSNYIENKQKVLLYSTTLSCVILISIIYLLPPLWIVGPLLFLSGFGLGGFMLAYTIGKEINSAKLTGSVIAMINTTDAILGALTEPLIGKVLDIGFSGQAINGVSYFSIYNYQVALSFLPVYLVLAIILVCFIKNPKN